MAIDKKRAEKARKSQLEGFINTCLPLDSQPSSGENLRTMAGYDSIRYGKTVSVTKYIRNLISADIEHRKKEYEKVKNI